jgi:hypothetical protein
MRSSPSTDESAAPEEDRVLALYPQISFLRAYNRSMATPSSINDDQAEVVRVLNEYYSAVSTLKVEGV